MKVKKTPFKASQGADTNPLPFYYDLRLPEHVKAAHMTAMTASMNAAVACASGRCACNKKGFDNHLNEIGQAFLAFRFVQLYSNTVVDGKRGTSDRERFKAIFQEAVPRCYPAFLAFLQRVPDAVAALQSLSEKERLTTLTAAAIAQVHLLLTPADHPLSLTWPAIAAPMQNSEVH